MTISAVQMQPGKNEREREREERKGKGLLRRTLFERSLSASPQPGKEKYTGPLCIRVECARIRGF